MEMNAFEKLHRINYLTAETEALYHQASLKLGISDSAMRALYTIYDNGESCMLSDIYKQSGISKQTVNSAIRKLEDDEILYLEHCGGRGKKVFLTEKGKLYIQETAARLYAAECEALASWTEEEIDLYIRFMEKYVHSFRDQVQRIERSIIR